MASAASRQAVDSPPGVQERLLAAGTAEFVRHGFQGASVSTIVTKADCNVRMVYHYFGNKMGLYRACIERVYTHLRDAEAEAGFWAAPPADAIAQFVRFTYDYMLDYPEFQGLMRIENMTEGQHVREVNSVSDRAARLFQQIKQVLDCGYQDGVFHCRPDPRALYLTVLGLCTIHITNRHTMGIVLGRDLATPDFLATRREEVVSIVLSSLRHRGT